MHFKQRRYWDQFHVIVQKVFVHILKSIEIWPVLHFKMQGRIPLLKIKGLKDTHVGLLHKRLHNALNFQLTRELLNIYPQSIHDKENPLKCVLLCVLNAFKCDCSNMWKVSHCGNTFRPYINVALRRLIYFLIHMADFKLYFLTRLHQFVLLFTCFIQSILTE